jgi:hypothetical protein
LSDINNERLSGAVKEFKMAKYIYVPPKFGSWLQQAVGGAVAGAVSAGVGAILQYLKENKVPHGCVDSERQVPEGHHYHRVE